MCCVVSAPEIGSWYGNAHALEAPFAEGSDKPLCSQRDALDRRRGPIWLPTLAQTLCFLPYVAARVPITVTLPGTEGTPPQTHVRSRDSNPATPPMGCEEDNWLLYFVVVKTTGTTPPDHWTIPLCSRVCARANAEHKVRIDSFALIWCNLFGLPQKPASVSSNPTRGRVRVPQSGRDLNPLVVLLYSTTNTRRVLYSTTDTTGVLNTTRMLYLSRSAQRFER